MLVVLEDLTLTRTRYSIWTQPQDSDSCPWSVEEVMPPWLIQYCGPSGELVDDAGFEWCRVDLVGWPVRLLWVGAYSKNLIVARFPLSGLQLFKSTSTDKPHLDGAIPLRPIWSGQAVCAGSWFVFVGLLRAALAGVKIVVRRGRSRRGCCASCGYRLKGSASGVCPECGADVLRARSA